MAGYLLIFLLLAGETAVAFARRQWRRGLGGLLVIVLILGAVVYYLLAWNAVMLKVQRNATTPATQSIEPTEEPGP
jgi:hypothetical protein